MDHIRPISVLAIFVMIGCSDHTEMEAPFPGPPDAPSPPIVTILSHSDGDMVASEVPTLLRGRAVPSDGSMSQIDAAWVVNGVTACAATPVADDGETTCSVDLTPGMHEVTLTATNTRGVASSTSVSLIATSPPPSDRCDGSPAWEDEHRDGSLRRDERESYGLGPVAETFSFICIRDEAVLNVCEEEAHLRIDDGAMPSVLGGGGIRAMAGQDVDLLIEGPGDGPIFLRLDGTMGSFTITLNVPNASVTLTSTGTQPVALNIVDVGGDCQVFVPGALTLAYTRTGGNLLVESGGAIVVNEAGAVGGEVTLTAGATVTPLEAPECEVPPISPPA